ncbi:unnamed protein product [Peniophora sp. CBMAI 1063]|nr:unnamed protein product [Peniophora sp. CBMAI 1063]
MPLLVRVQLVDLAHWCQAALLKYEIRHLWGYLTCVPSISRGGATCLPLFTIAWRFTSPSRVLAQVILHLPQRIGVADHGGRARTD